MRHVENISDTKERVFFIFELEVGENVSNEEKRSRRDIVYCQEGSDEISNF